eukprot:COSAG01_NODE_15765_length_1302_cov_1.221945_2_plen_190_part_00
MAEQEGGVTETCDLVLIGAPSSHYSSSLHQPAQWRSVPASCVWCCSCCPCCMQPFVPRATCVAACYCNELVAGRGCCWSIIFGGGRLAAVRNTGAGYAAINAINAASKYLTPGQRVVVVDRGYRWGGHWPDQYSYVRLHQGFRSYAVGERPWTIDRPDNHLATKDEILMYVLFCPCRHCAALHMECWTK